MENASKYYGYDLRTLPRRQQLVLKIMYEYSEGWRTEEELEESLEKIFTDKRHKPK